MSMPLNKTAYDKLMEEEWLLQNTEPTSGNLVVYQTPQEYDPYMPDPIPLRRHKPLDPFRTPWP